MLRAGTLATSCSIWTKVMRPRSNGCESTGINPVWCSRPALAISKLGFRSGLASSGTAGRGHQPARRRVEVRPPTTLPSTGFRKTNGDRFWATSEEYNKADVGITWARDASERLTRHSEMIPRPDCKKQCGASSDAIMSGIPRGKAVQRDADFSLMWIASALLTICSMGSSNVQLPPRGQNPPETHGSP